MSDDLKQRWIAGALTRVIETAVNLERVRAAGDGPSPEWWEQFLAALEDRMNVDDWTPLPAPPHTTSDT